MHSKQIILYINSQIDWTVLVCFVVQQSDSRGEEAVVEPCGPCSQTAVPPARGKVGKQSVTRVSGVLDGVFFFLPTMSGADKPRDTQRQYKQSHIMDSHNKLMLESG